MRRLVLVAAFVCATALPALADPVTVKAGENGLGWTVADRSGCWLVTVAHVLAGGSSIIVTGENGDQAQGDPNTLVTDQQLDLGMVRLAGTLTHACSGSLGDADERPELMKIDQHRSKLVFHRATPPRGHQSLESFELEGVPSEGRPRFSVSPTNPDSDIQVGDSGGAFLAEGSGAGERDLPVGIEQAVIAKGTIAVLRMDVVRNFFESHVASIPALPDAGTGNAYRLYASDGEPQPGCGPLNLGAGNATCGYRARRTSRAHPISVTLDYGTPPRALAGVRVQFGSNGTPRGIAVATSLAPADRTTWSLWSIEHYCPVPAGAAQIDCTLAPQTARFVRITVDGAAAEITHVDAIAAPPDPLLPRSAAPLPASAPEFSIVTSWTTTFSPTFRVLHVRISLHPQRPVTVDPRDFFIALTSPTLGVETVHGADEGVPSTDGVHPVVGQSEDLGYLKQIQVGAGQTVTRVVSFRINPDDDASAAAVAGMLWIHR